MLDQVPKDLRILIVDDFSTMRRIVRNLLQTLGFTNIEEAEDGDIALGRVTSGGVGLIISDWNMPKMMGMDLLREIRGRGETKEIPFLMVTPESRKEDMIEAMNAGASSFVVKPFTAEMLAKKLESIFAGEPVSTNSK